jgi:hypothetical protein
MATDITVAIYGIAINDKRAVCSTMPTGNSAKLLVRPNYPVDLTISNIESKYDELFDDITYYTLGN